jgi:MFS family permease
MTSGDLAEQVSSQQVRLASRATYIAFAGSGFAFASWAARIPQVRDHFHLQPSTLGFVLLAIAGGSVIALPLSGPVVARFGARQTVAAMALVLGVGLVIVAAGYLIGLAAMVVGLFVLGFANGAWDVAMNVHGAGVERHLGRSVLPRYHAGWSLGTVAGALVGVIVVALNVPVTADLAVVGVLVAVVVPLATRQFLPSSAIEPESTEPDAVKSDAIEPGIRNNAPPANGEAQKRRSVLAAWREPRTLAIGLFVLAFAFAEGTGNDWISVATIDGYHEPAAVGTLAFATFLAAMTAGRWFAPVALDRFGRVPVIRVLAVTGIVGVGLFVLGPAAPVAFVGVLLWGAGTSAGFPVGMSAGADDPKFAAGRVSVIACIGYCAFLGGPPLVGFLGNHITVLDAITAVAVLFVMATFLAPAIRPLPVKDGGNQGGSQGTLTQPAGHE